MFTVSETMPPPNPHKNGADYWERSTHPFNRGIWGWLAIDYAENPVGFIEDGFEYSDDQLYAYLHLQGPACHPVAVPYSEKEHWQQKYANYNKKA